jgi:hypothetical protein
VSLGFVPAPAEGDLRLARIIQAAMTKAGLASSWEQTVLDLATGRLSRDTLRCCGSGCRPCVQDIQRCVLRVVNAWQDPRFEAELLAAADGSIGGRARRIAKRALRKLSG